MSGPDTPVNTGHSGIWNCDRIDLKLRFGEEFFGRESLDMRTNLLNVISQQASLHNYDHKLQIMIERSKSQIILRESLKNAVFANS